MFRDHHPNRLSVSSAISWSAPVEDPMHHHDQRPSIPHMERSRQASTCSERSCEGMTMDETRHLWRCMLELQQRYGCYNSTRLDMAVDAGESAMDLMPSRFIIDTLNESVIDLPDEGRELLNRVLSPSSCTERHKWKFWKKD